MDHTDNNINQDFKPDTVEMDAGSQALTNAFQKAFIILKIVMFVIIAVFLFRGIFKVNPGERALVVRFGQIRDEEPLTEGLHWAWPEPISEVIIIPVKETQVLPIDLFWYFQTEQEKLTGKMRPPGQTLTPGKDGYCLVRSGEIGTDTGMDYNIVHARWQLTYSIARPELFYKNVYCRPAEPGESFLAAAAETVNPMLESLAADAIVETMVQYSIDKAIVSDEKIPNDIKYLLQEKLRKIQCGISVDSVHVDGKITWPRQVNDKFEESNRAKQNSRKMVEEAHGYADKLLSEAGGKNTDRILEKLKDSNISQDEKELQLSLLSGTAQEKISQAKADRTKIVKTAQANAEYYKALLPEFKKRPRLVVQKLYQDAVQEVLQNADEKILIEPAANGKDRQLRVMLNRDPNIKRNKEDKNKEEQDNQN